MDSKHARAQLFQLLYDKNKTGIAKFLRRHSNSLPPESFTDIALFFEGGLRRKGGRKAADGVNKLVLAQEYGKNLALVGTVFRNDTEAKRAAAETLGMEHKEARALSGYMKDDPKFQSWVNQERQLTSAWLATLKKIESKGPEITREEIESYLADYVRKAVAIDPDGYCVPSVQMSDGECVSVSRKTLGL
ncbi:hypothetical protein [Desulfovibrio sp. Fe33]|uniref:hypothetical protein n=1 Tax=Desulfovibrio sp. Fe33 TaxID=3020842 RepID=UPI00234C0B26|nr:hypothetical protein [Desulfovibrio sp. Fe33]